MRTISVPLTEIFDFPSIKGLTEEFINKHLGNIPVYGGKKTETPIGFIADNIEGVKYFANCLAWNREGSVGYVFYHKHRFSTNDHQRPLILKEKYCEKVNLDYISIVLQHLLLSQGFEWSKTASKEKVQKMFIDIPIDEFGEFDIGQQNEYVVRYNRVQSVQKSLSEFLSKINKSIVVLKRSGATRTVYLSDSYFKMSIGKRVLKKEVIKDGVPLYSANPHKVFGYVRKSNLDSFNLDSLIWGIDGNFEWDFIPQNKPFATTDHCGRLVVLESDILSEYVYYQLRESSSSYGFNRTYRASLQNIEAVSIEIPIDENGNFDVLAQKELIEKYKTIDSIKLKLSQLIINTIEPQVDV